MKLRDFFVIGYMILIFIISSLQNPPQPDLNVPLIDKWEHMIEYSILGILICNSLSLRFKLKKTIFLGIIIGVFYGLTDEIHQFFVPNRHCDLLDLLADSIGILIGTAIFSLYYKIRHKVITRC
jgi:VanZ family protein